MTPAEAALFRLGTAEPAATRHVLRAGDLGCVLEDGALRHVTWCGQEVVRGIAYLLRDRDWGTPRPRLSPPAITAREDHFSVSFEAAIPVGPAQFRYAATITGHAGGTLDIAVTGEADAVIETNRCGFVILHPAGFAGLPLAVTHTDGRVTETRFPSVISPGQPVLDIRALRCEVTPGLRVTCRMEAELPDDAAGRFEMEDQRNWSDASFKTYVGSLLDPWPYRLPPGRRLAQRVSIRIEGTARRRGAAPRAEAALRVGVPRRARLPAMGLGVPRGLQALDAASLARIGALRPGWLIVAAEPDDPGLAENLASAARLSDACGAAVQLELVLPLRQAPAQEAASVARVAAQAGLRPAAILACPRALMQSFQPSDTWPDLPPQAEVLAALRAGFPGARVGGGMVTYFTELNRCRPAPEGLDFISHTTAPIVHAADDVSVMETLEALPHIARSVRAIWPGLPYRIGPSSLAMRSNPYGATLAPNPGQERVALAGNDPRQAGLFAAAWTIGYAAALAEHGLECVALHASHGPSGLLATIETAWHAHARDGVVLPAFHALRALAAAGGCAQRRVQAPPGLAALAWEGRGGPAMALANISGEPRRVSLPGAWHGHVLDLPHLAEALADPHWLDRPGRAVARLELGPHACAFLAEGAAAA